jgi:hypothetical protein
MTVTVRPADLEVERESLFGPLERNLPDLAHRRRFDWLYRANPAGPAWSWFAYDDGTKEIVGVASVFPRAFWIGRRVERCGQVGDFAVDATHRSLGPAVLLQRATFQPVDHGVLAFCYDCPPHDQGMATFRRLGIETTCRTHHYARPLRAERQVERRLGRGAIPGAVTAIVNRVLAVRVAGQRRAPRGVEIAEHVGRFGEEFSVLDRDAGASEVVRSRRSAEDLNWRYRDDPLHRYHVLTARRGGELEAFVVFASAADDALVLDLFGHLPQSLAVALLDAAATAVRSTGAQTLRMTIGEDNEGGEAARGAGFWPRGQGPRIVAYAGRGIEARTLQPSSAWRIRQIDLMA